MLHGDLPFVDARSSCLPARQTVVVPSILGFIWCFCCYSLMPLAVHLPSSEDRLYLGIKWLLFLLLLFSGVSVSLSVWNLWCTLLTLALRVPAGHRESGGRWQLLALAKPSPNSVLGVKFAEFSLPSLLIMWSAQTQAPAPSFQRLDPSIDLPSTSN